MPASARLPVPHFEPFPLTAGWLACSHRTFLTANDAVCYTRNVCMDPLEVSAGYVYAHARLKEMEAMPMLAALPLLTFPRETI
jgi:hypothetical protein